MGSARRASPVSAFAPGSRSIQDPPNAERRFGVATVQQGAVARSERSRTASCAALLLDASAWISSSARARTKPGLAYLVPATPAAAVSSSGASRIRRAYTVVARLRRSTGDPLVADPASRFDLVWPGTPGPPADCVGAQHPYICQAVRTSNGGTIAFRAGRLFRTLEWETVAQATIRSTAPRILPNFWARSCASRSRCQTAILKATIFRLAIPSWLGHRALAAARRDLGFRRSESLEVQLRRSGARRHRWARDWRCRARSVGRNRLRAAKQRRTRNYGWRNFEGAHANVTSLPLAYTASTNPIHECGHSSAISITRGYRCTGARRLARPYRGRYFFGDLNGRLWSIGLTIGAGGGATASGLLEHTAEVGGARSARKRHDVWSRCGRRALRRELWSGHHLPNRLESVVDWLGGCRGPRFRGLWVRV